MKKEILKVLSDNTETELRYVGGGNEPEIIVFTDSEDYNKEDFLSKIADEIVTALDKKPRTPKVYELGLGYKQFAHLVKISEEKMNKESRSTWSLTQTIASGIMSVKHFGLIMFMQKNPITTLPKHHVIKIFFFSIF